MIESNNFYQNQFVLQSEVSKYSEKNGWKKVKIVKLTCNLKGKDYDVLEKRVRYYPFLSFGRIGGVVLSVVSFVFCAITCGYGIKFKTVRNFFVGRQVVKIVKPHEGTIPGKTNGLKDDIFSDGENNQGEKIDPKKFPDPLNDPSEEPLKDPSNSKNEDNKVTIDPKKKNSIPVEPKLPVERLPSVPLDTSPYKYSSKFFEQIQSNGVGDDESFIPLTLVQVTNLVSKCPQLEGRTAGPNGEMTAVASILKICEEGIPEKLGAGEANQALIKGMKYVLYHINKEEDKVKQQGLFVELADSVEGCAAATAGSVNMLYLKIYYSSQDTEAQLRLIISEFKEKVFEDTILDMFPKMKEDGYAAKTHATPSEQFPHVKNGYLAMIGKELGLNTTGVELDTVKKTGMNQAQINAMKNKFFQNLSMSNLIKEVVIAMNTQNARLDYTKFMQFCVDHDNLENDTIYDDKKAKTEANEYPLYSPIPQQDKYLSPFFTEKSACEFLRIAGYIQKK